MGTLSVLKPVKDIDTFLDADGAAGKTTVPRFAVYGSGVERGPG